MANHKGKQIKVLRKKWIQADRSSNPLEDDRCAESIVNLFRVGPRPSGSKPMEDPQITLRYLTGTGVENDGDLLENMLSLFERNMADYYRSSSWGLNLQEKKAELTHHRARHILVFASGYRGSPDSVLAAFLHYRFDYDDEEIPKRVVLYVYEVQVDEMFQRRGIGRGLMQATESIASVAGLDRILLTVFRNNENAMKFYTQTMRYIVDETSPSKFGGKEDYEILAKIIPR